jgi:uncharacterized membrane protein YgdD (TMEM256/DUF423 family)
MNRKFLHMAALMGALAVVLGAFGTHKLREVLSPETYTAFQTGVSYQFYHTFALLAVGILYRRYKNQWLTWAGMFFVVGTIFFSGSLYLMAALSILGRISIGPLGIITPFGGLLFIAGWVCLYLGIPTTRHPSDRDQGSDEAS